VVTANLPVTTVLLYDSNGNLTNDGMRSFAYSAENQLTNVFVPQAWKTEFVYDGLGRRRIERDYTWTGSTWSKTNEVRYVCDRWLAIQERDTNNNVLVTYTRGLDLSGSLAGAGGIGGLLARTDGNGSTFYHADGAGNITGLMDGQQNMAARYMYAAFGKIINQQGPMAGVNRIMFSSKEHLAQAPDIYGFGARDYFVGPQRWGSQDPMGVGGGLNLYGFVGNSPINSVDPFGLTEITIKPVTRAGSMAIPALWLFGLGVFGDVGAGVTVDFPDLGNGWKGAVPDLSSTRFTASAKGGGMLTAGVGFYAGEGPEIGINLKNRCTTGFSLHPVVHGEVGVFPDPEMGGAAVSLNYNPENQSLFLSPDVSVRPGVGLGVWEGIGGGGELQFNTPTIANMLHWVGEQIQSVVNAVWE